MIPTLGAGRSEGLQESSQIVVQGTVAMIYLKRPVAPVLQCRHLLTEARHRLKPLDWGLLSLHLLVTYCIQVEATGLTSFARLPVSLGWRR